MSRRLVVLTVWGALFLGHCHSAPAQLAGTPGTNDLVIADKGLTEAIIVVSPDARSPTIERMAADDLAKYIELMSGATPAIADTPSSITDALASRHPVFIVGSAAFRIDGNLMRRVKRVAKKDPGLRADAIVVRRSGNLVYLAGLTDDGHYHAVAHLLHRWGCRWYLPTDFGECIPEHETLMIGNLDHAYASPFELRSYWISWNGSPVGRREFSLRNFMTVGVPAPGCGHALRQYTQELIPQGKTMFDIPIAEQRTIAHVAGKIEEVFKSNGTVSLAMEDGVYQSDSPVDARLRAGLWDKYMMTASMTDVFMTFYNGVCERLLNKYPESTARIGFLAYSNITIPPQRVQHAAKPLVCALAPIDIDPIHGMDDPISPPRQEYRNMLYRWAEVMEGRVWIYDYDQGMLVWRDLPNPSHQAFRQDVQHYRKAGILGIYTESRNAIATTFLNLHMRGQLMWNPALDVDGHLAEFYGKFYGPAAEPMRSYWSKIFTTWEETIITEHEFFVAPAIYTPSLIDQLRRHLQEAEERVAPLHGKENLTRNEHLYLQRMRFTRLSFDLIDQYMTMVRAATTECDYKTAHDVGKKALQTRLTLARMNPTFTTRVVGPAQEPDYGGSPAGFPGEVKLYGDLEKLTDGTKGKLLAKLPLRWAFRRDPHDTGIVSGFAHKPVDLSYFTQNKDRYSLNTRKDYPTTAWEMLRTDLYMQAQGILHVDGQSFTGCAWYRTTVRLPDTVKRQNVHLRFPGIFANCWLWLNGQLVGHRTQHPLYWRNDYGFQWDVDLTGKLKPGENLFAVRVGNQHHVAGMFRRPFLYVPTEK